MTLLDPCAGEGEAIFTLAELWTPEEVRYSSHRVVACELEAGRARALRERAGTWDQTFHGDAFRLLVTGGSADVVFVNPPYDTDPDFGRLEMRFLDRFGQALRPGGVLLFLIPHAALTACADHLAHHYLDVRAWRLPRQDFARYGQILVVATRAEARLVHPESSRLLETWSRDPSSLPELPTRCPEPICLEPSRDKPLEMKLEESDVQAALDAFRPFDEPATGFEIPARDLFGRQFTTAMPPKPVHIAMALSTGMFNGHPLEPRDSGDSRHPVILLKGVFERIHVPVRYRRNEDGEVTAVVEDERPRLITHILRLDTGEFHELEAGVEPTGSDDPDDWNLADVIEIYEKSLVGLLRQQFPPLYDPHHFADRFVLPRLPRTPYPPQAHAVRAALRLVAHGKNPILDAEVGTGKTTMSLTIARLLSPESREKLVQLCPFAEDLPRVEKTLVLCPPHLLDTWEEEAAAVAPDWTVNIVRDASDLEKPARLYVLSRETAKLGPRVVGISGACPACGSPAQHSATSNARNRRKCETTHHEPANGQARLARHLARVLFPAYPSHDLVAELAAAPALERHFLDPDDDSEPDTRRARVSPKLLDAFAGELVRTLEEAFGDPTDLELANHILQALSHLELDPQRRSQALRVLDRLAELHPDESKSLLHFRHARQTLVDPPDSSDIYPLEALKALSRAAKWTEWECHEPLYGLSNSPRRYPLSKVITDRYPGLFDLLILDEAHEFNHQDTAQSQAAHRLVALGMPTIAMTGTLMNGYASSLFANLHALSAEFQQEFGHDDKPQFVRRYGFLRTERSVKDSPSQILRHGTSSDRRVRRRKISEAPGVMPGLIFEHLLPTAMVVHKEEVDEFLPPKEEIPVPLVLMPTEDENDEDALEAQAIYEPDEQTRALLTEYRRLENLLLHQIEADRFQEGLSGKLFGALGTLPTFLDRATDDLPPFEIRYPESAGGKLIARADPFPASWRTPKETWALDRIEHYLDRDERVVVFLSNTGTSHLPERLLGLIREVTPNVQWLDVAKVPTHKRNRWIKEHEDLDVLLVNPEAVKTGLNSLTRFSVALWHQLAPAVTYRQANGRLHRLGQEKPVTIEVPYYKNTAQEVRFHLLAETVSTSKQVDALDLVAALKAAGVSEEESTEATAALSLGEAIYQGLSSRAA